MTDEWINKICASASNAQAASGVINDTVGFPGTAIGASAGGAAAARRAGAGAAGSARAGAAMGLYGLLVGLIAQTTTGQGWKPFGLTVVPKADLSM